MTVTAPTVASSPPTAILGGSGRLVPSSNVIRPADPGTAVSIAATKTGYGWWQALVLGMFCNALVCMAVWLCYSARSTADKVLAIVPPIAAFVAAGFEHSVANMYFIPYGLFVKSDEAFIATQQALPDLTDLTWGDFLWANLVPVTIGNIIGGALMVGAIYWFIYLRPRTAQT